MTYLVDVENVGGGWVDVVDDYGVSVLLFITRVPHMKVSNIERVLAYQDVQIVKCGCGVTDALDLQLSSYVGYLVAGNEDVVIVSNDNGYKCLESEKVKILKTR